MLTPIRYLKKEDYQNADGSWTRFPDQIWVDGNPKSMDAKEVMIFQYFSRVNETKKLARSLMVKSGNEELNYALEKIISLLEKEDG